MPFLAFLDLELLELHAAQIKNDCPKESFMRELKALSLGKGFLLAGGDRKVAFQGP